MDIFITMERKLEAALPAASACSCSIMAITNESGDIIGYTISAPDKTTGEMTSATFSIIDALPFERFGIQT